MVTFEITSERECIIDGVGIFLAGETKVLTPKDMAYFKVMNNGVSILDANFPPTVKLYASVDEDEETGEGDN